MGGPGSRRVCARGRGPSREPNRGPNLSDAHAISPSQLLARSLPAGVVGVLGGVGLCLALGGSSMAASAVAGVVGIAAALGVAPMLSRRACDTRHLGLASLGVSVIQTTLAIGAALALATFFASEKRPVVLGAVAGVFVATALQAVATLTLINRPGPGGTRTTTSLHPPPKTSP